MSDLKELLTLNASKEPFISVCKSILKRYENYPSSYGLATTFGTYMSALAVHCRPDGNHAVDLESHPFCLNEKSSGS
jgi:hypothetical protein